MHFIGSVAFMAVAIAVASAMPQLRTLHGTTVPTRFIPATSSGTTFNNKKVIPILEMNDVRDDSGQYSIYYVTGDGTTVSEQGRLKETPDKMGYVLVKEGTVQYKTETGNTITLKYLADENGFQATGDHLPVAPVA